MKVAKTFYLSAAFLGSQALSATQVSIIDAYRSALNRTETARIVETRVEQSDARVDQARAKFLPNLSFGASFQEQHNNGSGSPTGIAFSGSESYSRLTLSQSIYEGGKDAAALSSGQSDKEAQEQNLSAARLTVYANVARSFYSLLSAAREVENIRKTSALAMARVKEIRNLTNVGRSRKVELLAAEAQLSVLQSQLMAVEGQVVTMRDQFALITGLGKDAALEEPEENVPIPQALESHLSLLENRPDILAIKAQIKEAEGSVRAAKAGHYPSLTAIGNYYFTREGSQRGNDWDAGLLLSFPLFAGGAVSAQVREFSERQKERELLLNQARRQAEIDIRTAYNNLMAALNQVRSLQSALGATEQNYKEQERNYRFSQATNLDVIQALNVYMDTKRTYDRTRYQAMTSWAELKAATAQVPKGQE